MSYIDSPLPLQPRAIPFFCRPCQNKAAGARRVRQRQKQQEELRVASAQRLRVIAPLGDAMLHEVEAILGVRTQINRLTTTLLSLDRQQPS